MTTPAPRSHNAKRSYGTIAVLRALQLGDLMCSVPAFRSLRAAYPHAHITLIGLPWAEAFVRRFGTYFDDFIRFPGYPGLPETSPDAARVSEFIRSVRTRSFDLILQMHGNGTVTNPLARKLATKDIAGFFTPGNAYPPEGRFFPYPWDRPEVMRHLDLMRYLGIRSSGTALEFPIKDEDRRNADDLKRRTGIPHEGYICVHPGARDRARRWKHGKFAQIADQYASDGYTVVFTGTAEERSVSRKILSTMTGRAVDLTGKTDLGTVGALLENATLLLCNDTGVSHIAAALGTPSVILFKASDPVRWAPLDSRTHKVVNCDKPGDIRDAYSKSLQFLKRRPGGAGHLPGGR